MKKKGFEKIVVMCVKSLTSKTFSTMNSLPSLSQAFGESLSQLDLILQKEFCTIKTTLLATKQTIASQAHLIETLQAQVAGLKNANEQMKNEVEALKFRAERNQSAPDYTAMINNQINNQFAQLRNNLGCLLLGNQTASASPIPFNPDDNIDDLALDRDWET